MPQNYFITGLPKAGKTVLLRRLIKALKAQGLKVGGLISPEESHHGTRTGFYVKDIASGKIARLADVDADGPKVSKYHVDVKSFEGVAVPAMKAFGDYDVIVIDEVGPMELKSAKFSDLLDDILDSDTPLIASLHQEFASKFVVNGEVVLLAENNREAVYDELLESIKAIRKKSARKKPAKAAPAPAKKAAPKEAKTAGNAPAVKASGGKKPAAKAGKAKPEKAAVLKKKAAKEKSKKPEQKREGEKPEKKGIFHHLKELFHG